MPNHQENIGGPPTAEVIALARARKAAFEAAFHRNVSVRIAVGLCCPRCGRKMRASDLDASDLDKNDLHVALVCQGCHQDVLAIEER
jgi:hypothetical protein